MVVLGLALLLQAGSEQPDDALREARSAQSRFETIRRAHLPREPSSGGQRCHAVVGRYCYLSDGDEDLDPPAEADATVRARADLIAVLDRAIAAHPTNAWLHGQRTRYLLEAGDASRAIEHASSCRAERWWCSALEGLALHVAKRYRAADSVFAIALDSMPPAQRCEWTDLRRLVARPLQRQLERATCEGREALATRLWTLAQPMWMTPGNDLRTEHFARHTMADIQTSSAIAHGMRFSNDSRELMVRYGWSEWFTRSDRPQGLSSVPAIPVTGHSRDPSFAFFPGVESLAELPRLSASSWDFRDSLARARYAPRHLRGAVDLDHQLARVLRGDSMVIAVAYHVTDARLAKDFLSAHVIALHDGQLRAGTSAEVASDRARGILRISVPTDTVIASLEVWGDSTERMARARYTVDPIVCGRLCVSDIVLFDGDQRTADMNLDAALTHAIIGDRHSVRRPLGVYWEAYGAMDSAGAEVSLMVTPARPGRLRRIATALRLSRAQSPIRLRWRTTPQGAIAAESVILRLPDAARGTYRVVLTIDPVDGRAVTSSREIELVP